MRLGIRLPRRGRRSAPNCNRTTDASFDLSLRSQAEPLRYPYAASLQFLGEHFCGGALLGPDVVLTAGHCAGGSLSSSGNSVTYDVVVGRRDLSETWGGTKVRRRMEVRHPMYDEETVDNDFNLVFLRKPIELEGGASYVRPNVDPDLPYPDAPLSVVGYGDLDPREDVSRMSDELLEAEVYYLTNEECEASEGPVDTEWGVIDADLRGGITDNMMCALAEGRDACQVSACKELGWGARESMRVADCCVGTTTMSFTCTFSRRPPRPRFMPLALSLSVRSGRLGRALDPAGGRPLRRERPPRRRRVVGIGVRGPQLPRR